MQTYSSEQAKLEAYQFSDPFATSSFVCCNKKLKKICRPNCDYFPKVSSRQDITFCNTADEAVSSGFDCCVHCNPDNPTPPFDLPLIKLTIETVNTSIGFTEDANDFKKRRSRALSAPSLGLAEDSDKQISRNECDHVNWVDLACRHLATAAALDIEKRNTRTANKGLKKRRGGVLGFKDLASIFRLSPWHFHRVFRNITGCTSKAYGDKCWNFIEIHNRPPTKREASIFKPMSKAFESAQAPQAKHFESEEDMAPTSSIKYGDPQLPYNHISTYHLERPASDLSSAINMNPDLLDFNSINGVEMNLSHLRHHSMDSGAFGVHYGQVGAAEFLPAHNNPIPEHNNNQIPLTHFMTQPTTSASSNEEMQQSHLTEYLAQMNSLHNMIPNENMNMDTQQFPQLDPILEPPSFRANSNAGIQSQHSLDSRKASDSQCSALTTPTSSALYLIGRPSGLQEHETYNMMDIPTFQVPSTGLVLMDPTVGIFNETTGVEPSSFLSNEIDEIINNLNLKPSNEDGNEMIIPNYS